MVLTRPRALCSCFSLACSVQVALTAHQHGLYQGPSQLGKTMPATCYALWRAAARMSGRHGQHLKPGRLHAQIVGLAGVEFQAIQAGEDAGASEDDTMDQSGESAGDDSSAASDGPELYEEGNDVRGCSSCQTPAASCCLLQVCVHPPKWPAQRSL